MSPISDTVILSTDNSSMCDYPVMLQASGGDAAIEYSAQDLMRSTFDAIYRNGGRREQSEFIVSQRSAGANFSVDVSSGYLIIQGTTTSFQGKYLMWSTGVINVTTPSAPSSGTRIHRLVVQINDKQITGTTYGWRLWLMEDTGTGTPNTPANAISLATITIASGQSSVTNSNITDTATTATIQHGGLGEIYRLVHAASGSNFLSSAASGSATYTNMSSGLWRLQAGRIYRIKMRVAWTVSVGIIPIWFIAKGTTSTDISTIICTDTGPQSSNSSYIWHQTLEYEFVSTADEQKYFNLAVQNDGPGTIVVKRGGSGDLTYISLTDLGPTTDRISYVTGA